MPQLADLQKVLDMDASSQKAIQINTFDRNPDEDAILQDLGKSLENNFKQHLGFGDKVFIELASGNTFT